MKRLLTLGGLGWLAAGAALAQMPPAAPTAPALVAAPTALNAAALAAAPAPDPAVPLDLETSIDLALRRRGEVGVAQQQTRAATERVVQARSPLFPQANGAIDYQTEGQTGSGRSVTVVTPGQTIVQSGRVTSGGVSHAADIVFSQTFFNMGETQARVRGARAGEDAARAGMGVTRSGVALDVANAYFEQLRRSRLLELTNEQVKQAQQHLELVQAQVDAGIAARIDLQPVLVEVSQARFNQVAARNAAVVAQTNFRNALGLGRGPALTLRDVAGPQAPPAPLETYLDLAARQRPDLVQANANIRQSEATRSVAKIQSRPQLFVSGNYDFGFSDAPLDRSWVLQAQLSIPIFNAGARRAAVREAAANLEADRIRQLQLQKDIQADVETAHANAASAGESIVAANALLEQARVNQETAREKYRQGLGIVLEITNADVQFFNAQTSAYEALYNYYQAQAALDQAVGRWALPTASLAPALTPPATTGVAVAPAANAGVPATTGVPATPLIAPPAAIAPPAPIPPPAANP